MIASLAGAAIRARFQFQPVARPMESLQAAQR